MSLLVLLLWLAVTYTLLFLFRFLLISRFSGLALLIFNRPGLGVTLFNILLFPGVIIHELSHFLMAAMLNVPTGKITIFPHQDEGEQRLGSVQIAHTDPLRESLIGGAPLVTASVSLVALAHWQFPGLFTSAPTLTQIIPPLSHLQTWIWFYAVFTLSNTMFTSKSDRRAWPFLIGLFVLTFIIFYALNLVKPIQVPVINFFAATVTQLNIAFTLTIAVDLGIIFLLILIEKLVSLLTGRHLRFNPSW